MAIARSRLGQDCELLREVMVSWVRQISSDGNYVVAGQAGGQSQIEGGSLAHEEDRVEGRVVLYSSQSVSYRLFVWRRNSLGNEVIGGQEG